MNSLLIKTNENKVDPSRPHPTNHREVTNSCALLYTLMCKSGSNFFLFITDIFINSLPTTYVVPGKVMFSPVFVCSQGMGRYPGGGREGCTLVQVILSEGWEGCTLVQIFCLREGRGDEMGGGTLIQVILPPPLILPSSLVGPALT